jgi:thiol-disulfide isomerase/thioredoxin
MKYSILAVLFLAITLFSCKKEDDDAKNSELSDLTTLSAYNEAVDEGVSIIFFHATWCPKCSAQRPAVEELIGDADLSDVFFGQVDFEKVSEVVSAAGVQGFPTILFIKNGVEEARFTSQGHSAQKIKDKLLELVD